MSRLFPTATVAAILAASAAFTATPADARIECRGEFQVTRYGLHASPYCQEEVIARVARSYGYDVTDRELHRGDGTKVRICMEIGGDTRLKSACGGYYPPPVR